MNVKEAYTPYPVAANGTVVIEGPQMGGFLCTAAGTVNVINTAGVTLVSALPVVAGIYYPMPLRFGGQGGGRLVCSAGAAGTVFV